MTDEELMDALVGLYAYDTGSVDSGIHDDVLKERCFEQLNQMLDSKGTGLNRLTVFLTRKLRDRFMSEEALAQRYSVDDALEFLRWLEDETGMSFP